MSTHTPLTQEEKEQLLMAELQDSFNMIDKNGDNSLTKEELGIILEKMGFEIVAPQLDRMMDLVDYKKDGVLDFDEFSKFMVQHISYGSPEDDLRIAFDALDRNKDGKISISEFQSILRKLGIEELSDQQISSLIELADKNGDRELSFEEFQFAFPFFLQFVTHFLVVAN